MPTIEELYRKKKSELNRIARRKRLEKRPELKIKAKEERKRTYLKLKFRVGQSKLAYGLTPNRKLTPEERVSLINDRALGLKIKQLAIKYAVSDVTVHRILSGRIKAYSKPELFSRYTIGEGTAIRLTAKGKRFIRDNYGKITQTEMAKILKVSRRCVGTFVKNELLEHKKNFYPGRGRGSSFNHRGVPIHSGSSSG